MTTKAGVQVEGARELRATLKRAELEMNDLKTAHAEAAQLVARLAAVRAPRRTGTLAGNVRGSGAATSATIRAGGARVPYALPIHWGWAKRGIAAQPFVSQAAQETETEWVHGIYLPAVQRILSKVRGIE